MKYKNNIYNRFANVNNIYLVFYGYVQGARSNTKDLITLKELSDRFISENNIDEDLDHIDFQNAYNRVNKMIIELKKKCK